MSIEKTISAKVAVKRAQKVKRDIVQREVMSKNAPLAVSNLGATLICGVVGNTFILTGKKSKKQFQLPTGQIVPATEEATLCHKV